MSHAIKSIRVLAHPSLPAIVVGVIVVGSAMLAGYSCGENQSKTDAALTQASTATAATSETPDIAVVVVPASWPADMGRDLPSLVEGTGTIFVGNVTAIDGQRYESAPIPTDKADGFDKPANSGPAPMPITAFRVRVDQAVAGDVMRGASIIVEQVGGISTQSDGTQIRIILEFDAPLQVGQDYLFFAAPNPNSTLSFPPFGLYVVDSDGRVLPPTAWMELPVAKNLAGLTTEEAGNAISANLPR